MARADDAQGDELSPGCPQRGISQDPPQGRRVEQQHRGQRLAAGPGQAVQVRRPGQAVLETVSAAPDGAALAALAALAASLSCCRRCLDGSRTMASTTPRQKGPADRERPTVGRGGAARGGASRPVWWVTRKLVVAVSAIVLSADVPIEPPTCCMVLTSADATPESSRLTPAVAVLMAGAMFMPKPNPMTRRAGSTPLA